MLELEAAIERAVSLLEQENYEEWHRFAFLAAVMANIFGKKRRFKPSDFIGPPPWKKKASKMKPVTPETVAELMEQIRKRQRQKEAKRGAGR